MVKNEGMSAFAEVAAKWLGADAGNVQMVSHGVNKNLSVPSHSGKVFVRFSPASLHPRSDLLSEAALLATARSQSLPCCEVIKVGDTLVGGPMQLAGLTYNWLVTREVVGTGLSPNAADAHAFGRSLAKIHTFAGAAPERSVADDPMPRDQLAEQYGTISDAFHSLPTGNSSYGLCHGDAWMGNGIRSGAEVVLIDFEWAKRGLQVYDIATFLWSLSPATSSNAADLFRAFLSGYSTVRLPAFDHSALRRAILEKELENLKFLRKFIYLTAPIVGATLQSSQALMKFALGEELDRFATASLP
jgi:Putative homoserine kinase type II (protein kinase fold)